MPRRVRPVFVFVFGLACVIAAVAALTAASGANTDRLGTKIDPLPIRDSAGQPVALPEAKATVVVFLSFDCPVSNSYAAPLAEIAREYGSKGVTFIGLNPSDAGAADVAKQAKDFALGFPVYRDERLAAVDALKAKTTPEAFVLDRHHILRYRGRIDDGYLARL